MSESSDPEGAPSGSPPIEVAIQLMLDLSDRLGATVVPVVVGYRSRWLAEGFSPEAAEDMAVAFHNALVAEMFTTTAAPVDA